LYTSGPAPHPAKFSDKLLPLFEELLKGYQRVLGPFAGSGRFIYISDHIRRGERIEVSKWYIEALVGLGFVIEEQHEVETPRQRFGANSHLRVDHENVFVLKQLSLLIQS
jgi:hypothetical protein